MSLSGTLNLLPRSEAYRRSASNQQRVLQFLQQEKFSTLKILQSLLGIKTHSGMWKILDKMAKKKWIKQHQYSSIFTIWGITTEGINQCEFADNKTHQRRAFMPSRVSLSTLEHSLDIQRVHVICDNAELNFQVGRELGSRAEADKVPDAIVDINGEQTAIEVERTLKSTSRYDAIIYNYLKAIKSGDYHHVLYIMPDAKRCRQVQKAICNLGHITMHINGRKEKLKLNPETHLSYFDFISLNKLPQYLQEKLAFSSQ